MTIGKETCELFMSLPTWSTHDALRLLLQIDPDSIRPDDDFDGSEIEVEVRALIRWLYRFGILPRAIREPYDAEPELISDYLDSIGGVHRPPAEWIAAAAANPGAPAEWLESLHSISVTSDTEIRKRVALVKEVIGFWPSVETDLSDAARNGLSESAKHTDHGFWKVRPALDWATQRGKIIKPSAQSFVASNNESALSPMLRQLLNLD